MYVLLVIIHVVNCLVMVGAVLLQSGKGADMGAAFGGSSQTVFGARGAATFLSKVTVGAAILFFVTSLSLSILTRARLSTASVIDEPPKASETTATPSASPTPTTTPGAAVSTTTTSAVEGTPAAAPPTDSAASSAPQAASPTTTTPAATTPTP